MSEKTLKEKTATGLMWGAINNLYTQVMAVIIGIFLARLLTPADYGLVGMLAIFSAIATSLQESGFIVALTNLKTISHRDYNAVFWFSTLMGLTLYALFFVSAPLIARYFHQPELVALSRVVFLSFVLSAVGTAHSAYLFRNMMNRERAIMGVTALTLSGAVGITLALNGYSYWSLAWEQFTFNLVLNIGRAYYVKWHPTLPVDFGPVRSMFGFSSKILATSIVNNVSNNILTLILGRLFANPGVVGNFTQAYKWNTMASTTITGTIGQIAQPVLATIVDDSDRQRRAFRKMLRFTSLLVFPAMLGLSFVSNEFIVITISDKWAGSVPLLRILCIGGAFLPIHKLYQDLTVSCGRSDLYMWSNILLIIVQVTAILTSSHMGVEFMVAVFTTVIVAWTLVWQCIAHRLAGITLTEVFKDIMPFLLAALMAIGVAYFATLPIADIRLLLAARTAITAVVYFITLKTAHAKILDECMQFLLKKTRLHQQ